MTSGGTKNRADAVDDSNWIDELARVHRFTQMPKPTPPAAHDGVMQRDRYCTEMRQLWRLSAIAERTPGREAAADAVDDSNWIDELARVHRFTQMPKPTPPATHDGVMQRDRYCTEMRQLWRSAALR
jgi:hypothetical protein